MTGVNSKQTNKTETSSLLHTMSSITVQQREGEAEEKRWDGKGERGREKERERVEK